MAIAQASSTRFPGSKRWRASIGRSNGKFFPTKALSPALVLLEESPCPDIFPSLRSPAPSRQSGASSRPGVAEHKVVDDPVMAVELPTPRLGGGGLSHDRDEIQPLAEKLMVAGELGKSFVEAHDVARQPHALALSDALMSPKAAARWGGSSTENSLPGAGKSAGSSTCAIRHRRSGTGLCRAAQL
jgi:hypothetical protein